MENEIPYQIPERILKGIQHTYSSFDQLGWAICIGYILVLFGPRFAQVGEFFDGLTYAAISRNMAEGFGTFWAPFFSTHFWLSYNKGPIFYEHPPLMFFLESMLFSTLGDTPYVEKIYSGIIFLSTLYLIYSIWDLISINKKSSAWIPIFVYVLMPEIEWTAPNNMLDNTMALFCLFTIWITVYKNVRSMPNSVFYFLFGSGVLLAFFSKGPIGLYVLITPLIWEMLFFDSNNARRALLKSLLPMVSFVVFFEIVLAYEPCRGFLSNYYQQQVVSAVEGKRELQHVGIEDRLLILKYIYDQIFSAMLILAVFILVLIFRKKQLPSVSSRKIRLGIFFFMLGLAGSVPIAISTKFSPYYLVPSLAPFAICFALWIEEIWVILFSAIQWKWSGAMSWAIVGCIIVGLWIWGGKFQFMDPAMKDVVSIRKEFSSRKNIYISKKLGNDGSAYALFMRYLKTELCDCQNSPYFLTYQDDTEGKSWAMANGYVPKFPKMTFYALFVKNE